MRPPDRARPAGPRHPRPRLGGRREQLQRPRARTRLPNDQSRRRDGLNDRGVHIQAPGRRQPSTRQGHLRDREGVQRGDERRALCPRSGVTLDRHPVFCVRAIPGHGFTLYDMHAGRATSLRSTCKAISSARPFRVLPESNATRTYPGLHHGRACGWGVLGLTWISWPQARGHRYHDQGLLGVRVPGTPIVVQSCPRAVKAWVEIGSKTFIALGCFV